MEHQIFHLYKIGPNAAYGIMNAGTPNRLYLVTSTTGAHGLRDHHRAVVVMARTEAEARHLAAAVETDWGERHTEMLDALKSDVVEIDITGEARAIVAGVLC